MAATISTTHWVHTYQNFRACGGLNGALRALGNLNTPPDTITPVTSPGVAAVPGALVEIR